MVGGGGEGIRVRFVTEKCRVIDEASKAPKYISVPGVVFDSRDKIRDVSTGLCKRLTPRAGRGKKGK